MSQIMWLLNLAPDIQEAILFLPKTAKGRAPINSRDVIRLAGEVDWEEQRVGWPIGQTETSGRSRALTQMCGIA